MLGSSKDGLFGQNITVHAETITELILERAGPVIVETFLLALMTFRQIPIICPARRANRKLLEAGRNSYLQTGPTPQ